MQDRELLEAKYTAPSGKEFVFLWGDKFSKKTELKTGVFTFPDRDGAHVQHQGGGPVTFSIVCIFNSDDHVKNANDFEAALLERGIAELQHPVYGIVKVIPTGGIERENDLINNINESRVTITFTETITDEPVNLEAVPSDEIISDFEEFSESAAVEFAENIVIENISEQLQITATLDTETDMLNENLSFLALNDPDFLTSISELKNNVKSLLNKVENLFILKLNIARLILNVMKKPSRMFINITEKIKGYSQLITQIIKQFKNDPFGINNIKNAFSSTRLILSGSAASVASGAALSIMQSAASGVPAGGAFYSGNGVMSRETAVAVAVQLKELLNEIKEFEDRKIENNNFIDSNAHSYLLLIQLVHKSIDFILNISFLLPMRRKIKLDRDRNFIELCAELYGSVDDYYLDKMIIENNLNIDDFEILPMGREMFYYA
ncbi:MAG: DNA circularization N-terminal domain-containing protein [Treponema sp.]|nr:DNA circularization N-terminal domain-containing protein [Treponema sp.]